MKHATSIQLRGRQRGVVLIFTLIVLLILTIGAVALTKSMNISMFSAGNLAFRQDLVNQGEEAIATVMSEFTANGVLVSATNTDSNQTSNNYSATMLPTNPQGVPNVLLNDGLWTSPPYNFTSADDLTGATPDVTMRYVIDRLCAATGASVSTGCVQATAAPTGQDSRDPHGLAPPTATVYRISVRVTGPRNTQVFLQSTFTKPN
jgi:Tfp pilus assembly protein PilX